MSKSIAVSVAVMQAAMFFLVPAGATIIPASIIGDGMVLQRSVAAPIWGTAAPGERVTVTLGAVQKSTVADGHGSWMVRLNPMPAGGPYDMTLAGENRIVLHNILVGEVWLCAGQSNMELPLSESTGGAAAVAAATNKSIRLFKVHTVISPQPVANVVGHWQESSPAAAAPFSAVAYYFGEELQKVLGVPVGLIDASVGGTPGESWTAPEWLQGQKAFAPLLSRWDASIRDYPQARADYQKTLQAWQDDAARAQANGQQPPPAPISPAPPTSSARPGVVYNGMIAPLAPYAIRGVAWYQGETSVRRAYQYRYMLPALINGWRGVWGQGNMPFIIVQLPNFSTPRPVPGDSEWAELREAQALTTATVPNTSLVVTIDLGDKSNLHPPDKLDVGQRLALAARAEVYKENVEASGPVYDSMSVNGAEAHIKFKHVDGGLLVKGDRPIQGFAIAGADRKFTWAQARLDGDSVIVSSPAVPNPVAVRYAWADNPFTNLYNKAGLPAAPFRTDDWPLSTANNL